MLTPQEWGPLLSRFSASTAPGCAAQALLCCLPMARRRSCVASLVGRWHRAPRPSTNGPPGTPTPTSSTCLGSAAPRRAARAGLGVHGDDQEACGRIIELFGDTPGKVRTGRGKHFLYRDNGASLGRVQSPRSFGINADIKHGRSIAVAPPSRHEDDHSFAYSWDGCDETAIDDLPPFNSQALQKMIQNNPEVLAQSPLCNLNTNVITTVPAPGRGGGNLSSKWGISSQDSLGSSYRLDNEASVVSQVRRMSKSFDAMYNSGRGDVLYQGSRRLGLNRYLCSQAWACDSFDELLDCAHTFNDNLEKKGYEPLTDAQVVDRANQVWMDLEAGKLERWHSGPAVARSDAQEIKDLASRSASHGGDAFMLLMPLRSEHGARVLRGETFALDVLAMVRCQTSPAGAGSGSRRQSRSSWSPTTPAA